MFYFQSNDQCQVFDCAFISKGMIINLIKKICKIKNRNQLFKKQLII